MIWITGGSSGIGLACAQMLARRGEEVVVLARRNQDRGRFRECKGQVHLLKADVRNVRELKNLIKKNRALASRARVLINNAGLALGVEKLPGGKIEDWRIMMETNVMGVLNMCSLLLPHLLKNKNPHIVNIGSVAGRRVYPGGSVYCATKHAVHAISQGLRMDTLGSGLRVTEVSPGMVETEFSVVRLGSRKKAREVYEGMRPLTAEDIAQNVLWAMDQPAHVNVQEVVVYPTDQAAPGMVFRSSSAERLR